jgi:hypothetical protein
LLFLNEKADREGKPVKIPEQTEMAKQCGYHTILVYRVSKRPGCREPSVRRQFGGPDKEIRSISRTGKSWV